MKGLEFRRVLFRSGEVCGETERERDRLGEKETGLLRTEEDLREPRRGSEVTGTG